MRRFVMLAVAALFTLGACAEPTEGKYGAELYEISCARCHASDGSGLIGWPPVGPGSNSVALDDDQLRGVTKVGPGTMPGFPQLSDEQIDSLVVHLRWLQQGG